MKKLNFLKKLTALSLAAALLLEAPGYQAYAAMGEMAPGGEPVTAIGGIKTPISIDGALPAVGVDENMTGALQIPGSENISLANPTEEAVSVVRKEGVAVQDQATIKTEVAPSKAEKGFFKGKLFPALRKALTPSSIKEMGTGVKKAQAALVRIFDGQNSNQSVLSSPEGVSSPAANQGEASSDKSHLNSDSSRATPTSLTPADVPAPSSQTPPPAGPSKSPILGAFATVARVAVAATAVVALQVLAVHLLPTVFGFIPVAAAWAVMSGVLALPAAIYTRYRLSRHDAPRLNKVKWVMDAAIGALVGASVLALPYIATVIAAPILPTLAAVAAVSGLGTFLAIAGGGRAANLLFGAASLTGLVHWIGVGAAGTAIGVAPLFAMMAIPAIATISFFLRFLISSAETGRPFSVPGALMGAKMRFPTFPWVMTGVAFALLTGYLPWHANLAFAAWTFLGDPKAQWDKTKTWAQNIPVILLNFNVLYAGLAIFAAATGFTSPATFLVLAFLPERAAHWTEALLQKFLPASAPAPLAPAAVFSTSKTLNDKVADKAPSVNRWLRTAGYLSVMVGAAVGMGIGVFGVHQLLKVSVVAIVLSLIPFLFSAQIIKKLQKATDTDRTQDPAIYRVVDDLRALENANRPGKKPIPVPEVVILPTELPNAFATGPSPFHAMVGVTQGTKDMLLTPENLRQNLIQAIAASDVASYEFKVLSRTISETIPGASETDTPEALSQAVKAAAPADIERLGERYLRGVLAHEFSHVMDRHMLSNFIMGSIMNAISFAANAMIWSIMAGRKAVNSVANSVGKVFAPKTELPEDKPQAPQNNKFNDRQNIRMGEENFAPLAVPVVAALPALVRLFLALWAPIILQMVEIAASRNNEAQADEDGAHLVRDPQALAAALVLLTNWRPSKTFSLMDEEAARLALSSHLFTVNPVEQLDQIGFAAKLRAQGGPKLSAGDDWLFYLLIMNHPETPARIQELWKMSEEYKAKNVPPAPFVAR